MIITSLALKGESNTEKTLVAAEQERRPIRFDTFKEYYPAIYKALKLTEGI
jgi:hypothetical protein